MTFLLPKWQLELGAYYRASQMALDKYIWATESVSWISLQISLLMMGVWIYLMHRHLIHEINATLNVT